jgi:ferrochelatase
LTLLFDALHAQLGKTMVQLTQDPPAIGVLLINLGTPDAPSSKAVKRYLAQFLSDKRVVELPAFVWQPILRGVILPTRPRKTAHAYQQIWNGGSPLAANTQAQAESLAAFLGPSVVVDYAMRYGNPSIEDRLASLMARGCGRILIAPLYPQYSAATTATALDETYRALTRLRAEPAIRTLPPYFRHPSYIDALRRSVEDDLAAAGFEPDAIVTSYHGMPERTEALGDPYRRQCLETTALLSRALGRDLDISFQSQFGPAKWFGPSTEALLGELPGRGMKRVAVLTPGFSADCIETLEEIDIRGRATFMEAGGERFHFIPSLNATEPGLTMLDAIIRTELSGWITAQSDMVAAGAPADDQSTLPAERTRRRAADYQRCLAG